MEQSGFVSRPNAQAVSAIQKNMVMQSVSHRTLDKSKSPSSTHRRLQKYQQQQATILSKSPDHLVRDSLSNLPHSAVEYTETSGLLYQNDFTNEVFQTQDNRGGPNVNAFHLQLSEPSERRAMLNNEDIHWDVGVGLKDQTEG